MTIDEYFQFLDQYWQIFGPPKEPPAKIEYTLLLI